MKINNKIKMILERTMNPKMKVTSKKKMTKNMQKYEKTPKKEDARKEGDDPEACS